MHGIQTNWLPEHISCHHPSDVYWICTYQVASALLAELHWRIVMSLIQLPPREESVPAPKITAQTLLDRKQAHQPITALTAYDYSTARLVDQAGIDMVLVGDSLGMAVLGYDSTLPVT